MIYRSNLKAPDLAPHFKHLHSRVMPHSFGHDVPSDWADKADDDPVFGIYKRCGMWTHDEAAILYNVAKTVQPGRCLDVGCHTGWTTVHIEAGHPVPGRQHRNLQCSRGEWGCSCETANLEHHYVDFVDPMLGVDEFRERFVDNCGWPGQPAAMTSQDWFLFLEGLKWTKPPYPHYVLACIDGDHQPGKPLEDAQGAARHLADTGVIIFHDFIGQPVREAVTWLLDHGFKAKIYWTPHIVACCWRGDFTPPEHVPDPELVKQLQPHIISMKDFDFARVGL